MKCLCAVSLPGIAIFCMLLTYYMWIKAVKTGSVYWSSICALAYFYMVRSPEVCHRFELFESMKV